VTGVLVEFLSLSTGLLLLLAGRRLFWLAVGLAAALLSWHFLHPTLGDGWLGLALPAGVGLLLGWLTVRFVRLAALLAGFLAGVLLLPAAGELLGLEVGWYALALAGGVGGMALVALAMKWGLVLATAFMGALILASGLRESLHLSAPAANVVLLILMALGVAWQGMGMRPQRVSRSAY